MVTILERQTSVIKINALLSELTFDFQKTVQSFESSVIPEMKAFIEDTTAEEELLEEDKDTLLRYKQHLTLMRSAKNLADFAQTLETPAHVHEFVHYANLYFLKIDSLLHTINLLLQDTTEYLMQNPRLVAQITKSREGEAKRKSFDTSEELDIFFKEQYA